MYIYVFVFIILILLSIVYDAKKGIKGYKFSYIITFLIITVVAGLRYKIGSDTLAYMDEYKYYPDIFHLTNYNYKDIRDDVLWVVFCSLCKSISDSYFFMQFIHAFLINSVFFYFIYKNTKYRFTAVFFYYILGFLYFNTEILRESMAVSVFLISLSSFYKKKWVQYYILVTVATLFHSSALITFIFPLFIKIKFNKFFIISLITVTLLASVIWQLFNENIKYFFAISSIESKANIYLTNELYQYSLNGIIYGLFAYVFTPLICVLYFYKKNTGSSKQAPLIWLYISLGIFIIYNNTIFTRFQNYLFFPFIILLSNIFNNQETKKRDKLSQPFQFFALFLIILVTHYYNYFKLDITNNTYIYDRYTPYHSILTKKTTKEREILDYYW